MNQQPSPLNVNSNRDRVVEGLPPIQLPPPIVHFYIAPPHHQINNSSPHQSPPILWHHQPPQPQAQLPPTPPPSTKENNRRSSHSAVEKRRRERMNDKIERLKTLIPSCNSQFPTTVQQPIHKLSVLQAAIDYIGELHKQLESSLPKDNPLLKDISVIMQQQENQKNKDSVKG
jgi:hypothetical protein